MKLESIIEILNNSIPIKGKFILLRQKNIHPKFKGYACLRLRLYYILGKNIEITIIESKDNIKMSDNMWNNIEDNFLKELFSLMYTNRLKELIPY